MYNINTSQWTWLSGNKTIFALALYGTKGEGSVNNNPGGRRGHAMVYEPGQNCLYMFGGNGFGRTTTSGMAHNGVLLT